MTRLITSDAGVCEFELPSCPRCNQLPSSDLVMVRCGCPGARVETVEAYLDRVSKGVGGEPDDPTQR